MTTPSLAEMATGVSIDRIPTVPVSTMTEQVIASDMNAVDKLCALCSIDRTYQNIIMVSIAGNMRSIATKTAVDVLNTDSLVVAGGKITHPDDVEMIEKAFDTLPQTSLTISGFDNRIVQTARIGNVGRINASLADMIEAVARVYQANYLSLWPYVAAMTGRAEPLSELAFWVITKAFMIVLHVREKGRTAKVADAAVDTINSDTALVNPKD